MPYIYRISRREARATVPAAELKAPVVVADEPSYRDLQAQAKELDIPANQTADDLKKAISEAEPDD